MNMPEDDELVQKLKEGDEKSFEILYERYATGLLRHLMCLVGTKEEAEDLLHECMMLMIKKINFYQPRNDLRNSFKSWLYRLSTNRAIDEIRKRKMHVSVEPDTQLDINLSHHDLYEEKEKEFIIGDFLMKLPLMQRTVLSLRVVEDLSYKEISAICGRDINAIKQGLFQARKSMKNFLIQQGELI